MMTPCRAKKFFLYFHLSTDKTRLGLFISLCGPDFAAHVRYVLYFFFIV
jgi:hypothetical protein